MENQRPSMSPQVGIVVLNYQGKDCLSQCLSSLKALAYPRKDIIMIDNASGDGSLEEAERLFPECTFVRLSVNSGFAKGMNVGIRLALKRGASYVWLFNNDARAEKESLTLLVDVAQKSPQAGLLSPLIFSPDDSGVWFAAGKVNRLRMRAEHMRKTSDFLKQQSFESEYLTGCSLLIRREVVERAGLLDEDMFLYYEDADYSLRARKLGFSTLTVPAARVWHGEQSRQNTQKLYYLVYSGLVFFGKHASTLWRLYFVLYVTIRRTKNVLDRIFGKKDASIVSLAYKDYFHEHTAFFYPRLR